MTMKLRPCPFCHSAIRSDLEIQVSIETQSMFVECLSCGARGWSVYFNPDRSSLDWLTECELKWNGEFKKT